MKGDLRDNNSTFGFYPGKEHLVCCSIETRRDCIHRLINRSTRLVCDGTDVHVIDVSEETRYTNRVLHQSAVSLNDDAMLSCV